MPNMFTLNHIRHFIVIILGRNMRKYVGKKNKRNSSFELLRILSMFAIVVHHFAMHGTLNPILYKDTFAKSFIVYDYLIFLGRLGVVLFVMIGAYFLCDKDFNFKRPINLILTTCFYSYLIYFVLRHVAHFKSLNILFNNEGLKAFWFPIPLPSGYWFVGGYIVLLLLMPMLNTTIKYLKKREFLFLIFTLIFFWVLIPTMMQIFPGKPDMAIDDFGYSHGIIFILFYFMAAYLKKYAESFLNDFRKMGIMALLCLILALLVCCFTLQGSQMNMILAGVNALYNPLTIMTAFYIFAFFKNIKFYNKFINYIANSMFGIYLISDNTFVRKLIWQVCISSKDVAASWLSYFGEAIGYSLLIFIVSLLLDIIFRRMFFEKLINKITLFLNEKILEIVKY